MKLENYVGTVLEGGFGDGEADARGASQDQDALAGELVGIFGCNCVCGVLTVSRAAGQSSREFLRLIWLSIQD